MPASMYDRMTVDLPDGELDGLLVEKFEVEPNNLANLRNAIKHGRGTAPGTYTKMITTNTFWMSDTDAEKKDHLPAVRRIARPETRRVLVNGLGLGMVLKAALSYGHVEHVDVVECDPRVIALVGPTYLKDPRVTIVEADAYQQAKEWPAGTRWDAAWHDIWPTIDEGNLPEMARLHDAYARRCGWQGSWGRSVILRMRAADQREAEKLEALIAAALPFRETASTTEGGAS